MSVEAEIVAHHLRLFGIADSAGSPNDSGSTASRQTIGKVHVVSRPDATDVAAVHHSLNDGGIVVALLPEPGFTRAFGIERSGAVGNAPASFVTPNRKAPWTRLRTLHPSWRFRHPEGLAVVLDALMQAVWLWVPVGSGGVLVLGTDLAGDLLRYRQGDPAAVAHRTDAPLGGIAGERPIYLFEQQLAHEPRSERFADWWSMALATFLADRTGWSLQPLLPGGAPGAIIITGDDDQAYLENYERQLRLINGAPITYFLHPQTKHTRRTLRAIRNRGSIDLGLHPDALDAPASYRTRLAEQVLWFKRLTGENPISLRNHGFLNDGYWGHLPHWEEQGIRMSSNLPGINGRVLNGSLLPARLVREGRLTNHWSILTAIGDGIVFALNQTDEYGAECVLGIGRQILDSGVPGIVVLNLHPDNIGKTRAMHIAARELIDSGFHAWTMGDCLAWFERKAGGPVRANVNPPSLWPRLKLAWGQISDRL